jgi:hypothetical protein
LSLPFCQGKAFVLEQLIDPIPEGANPEAVYLNRVLISLSCRTDLLDE